jgi:DNA-binding XRE family transcriptional regulator
MEQINELTKLVNDVSPPILKREFMAAVHKLRYPMAAILAKVPGDTIADRARAIGVSRQTYYVWQDEKFRPVKAQAKKISKLTGVPPEQIMEAVDDDARRPIAKKAAKLAGRGRAASRGDGRAGRRKR